MNGNSTSKRTLTLAAWAVMLAVSDLPDILITWLGGTVPAWIFWAKTGFLAAFLVLTLVWKALRPLWQYAAVFLTLFLALSLRNLVRYTDWFQSHFNYVMEWSGWYEIHQDRRQRYERAIEQRLKEGMRLLPPDLFK